ncbi:MAG: hypothetical protein PVH87_00990 [Desulfobacteraceae bacterium]|jgi:hypothetical protein
MQKRILTIIVTAAVVAMASACTGTPHLHSHWGKSIETARETQTVNPQAGRESMPAPEMDGNSAGHAVDGYHQSFKGLETQ